jgi:hypothetical protein
VSGTLKHDPEKWKPVFRKDHAATKNYPMIFHEISAKTTDKDK